VTGILIFAIRLKSRDDEWWYSFGSLAWFLHLAGLVGFLVSLSMFVWIKWTIVAIPVVIICIAACAAMIANLYFISRQFLD
jgi:peptidoglycan/LPS O-acetylase OafA/YrhL